MSRNVGIGGVEGGRFVMEIQGCVVRKLLILIYLCDMATARYDSLCLGDLRLLHGRTALAYSPFSVWSLRLRSGLENPVKIVLPDSLIITSARFS